ncbi:MAG: AI-2E family transporter, partial [Pseudomonadota bacterium]
MTDEAETSSRPEGIENIGASPTRITSPAIRQEVARAAVWIGMVGLFVLAVYISQSLLVVFGAMVFAAMIDGGSRLL